MEKKNIGKQTMETMHLYVVTVEQERNIPNTEEQKRHKKVEERTHEAEKDEAINEIIKE